MEKNSKNEEIAEIYEKSMLTCRDHTRLIVRPVWSRPRAWPSSSAYKFSVMVSLNIPIIYLCGFVVY